MRNPRVASFTSTHSLVFMISEFKETRSVALRLLKVMPIFKALKQSSLMMPKK